MSAHNFEYHQKKKKNLLHDITIVILTAEVESPPPPPPPPPTHTHTHPIQQLNVLAWLLVVFISVTKTVCLPEVASENYQVIDQENRNVLSK